MLFSGIHLPLELDSPLLCTSFIYWLSTMESIFSLSLSLSLTDGLMDDTTTYEGKPQGTTRDHKGKRHMRKHAKGKTETTCSYFRDYNFNRARVTGCRCQPGVIACTPPKRNSSWTLFARVAEFYRCCINWPPGWNEYKSLTKDSHYDGVLRYTCSRCPDGSCAWKLITE